MKYIYSYRNKINGKHYVGQTNDLKRRHREHLTNSINNNSIEYDSLIHKKFREYGTENFEYKVIESVSSNSANDREIYWIKEMRSLVTDNGYNISLGGHLGSVKIRLTKIEIEEIIQLIILGKTYGEISNIYKTSISTITKINQGVGQYRLDKYKYPIKDFYKTHDCYSGLLKDLRETHVSFKKLSEKHKLSESTVKKINYGFLNNGLSDTYPIRSESGVLSKSNLVKEMLLNQKSNKEIIEAVGVSTETIRRINNGITHYDARVSYPIRNL